jgi:Protein of unknown function (DUF3298)
MFRNLRTLVYAAVAASVLLGWSGTTTAGAQSACADLGGTVDADQICQVHSATSSYKIDLTFPVDYPDQQALSGYLTQARDGFVKFAQSPPAHPDWPYQLLANATTYRSGTPFSGTQSLVLDMGRDANPHPVTSFKAFSYDLGKHAPITFDTLFKPGTDPLEVLNPIVQRKFGPLPLGDPGVDTYQNFAITDDAVIFFFDQGALLGHADGPQQISVPSTELASLLA